VTRQLADLENKLGGLSETVARLEQAAAGDRPELTGLTSRIGALEARLGQAEGASQEVEGLAGRVGAVTQQITAGQEQAAGLSDKVGALGSQMGALSTRMDTLADTLQQLQQQATSREDGRARAASLALTVAQLDAALEGGESFEQVLDSVRGLDGDDPAVVKAFDTLQATAASGVPSMPELRSSFDRVADDIVHAAQAPGGEGLLDQAAGNLMRLVTVRPVGADATGESAAARVARAEVALAEGDLTAAVAELEPLEGAAGAAAASWLAQAHERLAAQAALAALQDRATRLLSEAE
jgi:uroporphyrinogen-III synthase